MTYRVVLKKSAQKQLQKLAREVAERILVRIYMLADDPYPPASTPLAGHDAPRLRVGDYRIIYEVSNADLIVHVVKVGHRGKIYKDL